MQSVRREDLACIIYTSGTGGAPRGVMQHHGSILANIEGAADVISTDFGWDDEIFLSFLPASHAYEHTGGQHFPIGLGAQIYYAESLEKLAANIEEVRPTIMVVVPRLFEMLRARILKTIEASGGVSQYLLRRALSIGAKKYEGRKNPLDLPMEGILSLTLRKKVRARFGGRMKAMVSGGAPLNPEVGLFFQSLGITFLQGYGQTEAGPVISCNRPSAGIRMDSVGPPVKDAEVRIAEDGEIMVRGELVMHGYWHNPEETARVLSSDGWLATGDVGHFDEAGRIVITDRKKDLIVNDKGDNVSPQRVEGMLTLQPEIAQAMVYGDRRPYLVALVVPEAEYANKPDLQQRLSKAVDRVNADVSVIERIRRFIIADEAVHDRQRAADAVAQDPAPRHQEDLWRKARRALRQVVAIRTVRRARNHLSRRNRRWCRSKRPARRRCRLCKVPSHCSWSPEHRSCCRGWSMRRSGGSRTPACLV